MKFYQGIEKKLKLINLNNNFFSKEKKNNNKKILVEYYDLTFSLIPFSYFSNILSKKYNAEIYTYKVNFYSLFEKLKFIIKKNLIASNYKVYKSFGTKDILYPKLAQDAQIKSIHKSIRKKIKNKMDILNIKFKNIPIGEYLYDEYLRVYNKSTIDINSNHFEDYLNHVIKLCFYWHKTLDPKEIKSVIVSHTTYLIGLVSIIAIYKNIPTYRVSSTNSFYLNKKFTRSFSDFPNYSSIIKKINLNKKKLLNEKSKTRILKYFLGDKTKYNKRKKTNSY